MLRAERDAVGFRHEIARVAVEEALSPAPARWRFTGGRSPRSTAATARAPTPRASRTTPRRADDAEAVLRFAPAAGERAAALGLAPRGGRAVRPRRCATREGLALARRAELLERRSYECYLTDRIAERRSRRAGARSTSTATAGDRARARATRTAGCRAWPGSRGDNATAEAEARLAVELLEPLAPGRELAMAYSNMAQLRMLGAATAAARSSWGDAGDRARRAPRTRPRSSCTR